VKSFWRLYRLIHIQFVLVRYNLDEFIFATPWFYPVRFLTYFNPYYWFLRNKLTRGERLRRALEDLGPIFVKAGQLLSTRRDFVPDDIADELAKLQDRVPPFPGTIAKAIIESALGCNIESVFSQLDMNALASASIAQVHAGTLLDGRSVVAKVLRPGIKKIIDRDLD
jgi:ubiquinone biosynthesis protein